MSDVEHSADKYKQIVLSIVDSGYTNFAVNFQQLSVDAIGLHNFLFVCIDQQAVVILQQHGIACSYFDKSITVQVNEHTILIIGKLLAFFCCLW